MVRILVGLRSSGGRYSSGILPIATSDRANRTLAPRASDLLWLWLRVLRPWLRGLGRGAMAGGLAAIARGGPRPSARGSGWRDRRWRWEGFPMSTSLRRI